ncbi:MAG TPA: hypothetical protein ENN34_11530 [Deltaproteobacteria bacterium]|nr:hypothetical protein [Deltaproteobacteria bacterium]
MSFTGYVKNTIAAVVPAVLVLGAVAYTLGYGDITVGLLIGSTGGIAKCCVMSYAAVAGSGRVMSFVIRYLIIGVVFVGGILISMHAFFASIAGVLLVQVIFVSDQVRANRTEEVG